MLQDLHQINGIIAFITNVTINKKSCYYDVFNEKDERRNREKILEIRMKETT